MKQPRGRRVRPKRGLRRVQRRDNEVAIGLVALGVRLHRTVLAQVLVDQAPLAGRHRVERDGPALAQGVLGGVIGLASQDHLAPLAISLSVDDDPPPVLGTRAADALREMREKYAEFIARAERRAQIAREMGFPTDQLHPRPQG